ncbi:MAG: hypothetical protein IPL26_22300 [Leptospiraceae bacterium]|nr:hypothetical protein [Leptospiraceae bacterium]
MKVIHLIAVFSFFLNISLFSNEEADAAKEKELEILCQSKTTEDSCMDTKGCSWLPPDDPNGHCAVKQKKGFKNKKKGFKKNQLE